jgi:hypothetical protein
LSSFSSWKLISWKCPLILIHPLLLLAFPQYNYLVVKSYKLYHPSGYSGAQVVLWYPCTKIAWNKTIIDWNLGMFSSVRDMAMMVLAIQKW